MIITLYRACKKEEADYFNKYAAFPTISQFSQAFKDSILLDVSQEANALRNTSIF